jgi:hypothetical protein
MAIQQRKTGILVFRDNASGNKLGQNRARRRLNRCPKISFGPQMVEPFEKVTN